MYKVLIAHSSEDLISSTELDLRGKYEIMSCSDGNRALELMKHFRPDAMVLDLSIPQGDGLILLEEAQEFLPPVMPSGRHRISHSPSALLCRSEALLAGSPGQSCRTFKDTENPSSPGWVSAAANRDPTLCAGSRPAAQQGAVSRHCRSLRRGQRRSRGTFHPKRSGTSMGPAGFLRMG